MDERVAKVTEKMNIIGNKMDEIQLLLCDMSDISDGGLDLLNERVALREWETTLREHYNEYATLALKNY
jgi:hypothetical protein